MDRRTADQISDDIFNDGVADLYDAVDFWGQEDPLSLGEIRLDKGTQFLRGLVNSSGPSRIPEHTRVSRAVPYSHAEIREYLEAYGRFPRMESLRRVRSETRSLEDLKATSQTDSYDYMDVTTHSQTMDNMDAHSQEMEFQETDSEVPLDDPGVASQDMESQVMKNQQLLASSCTTPEAAIIDVPNDHGGSEEDSIGASAIGETANKVNEPGKKPRTQATPTYDLKMLVRSQEKSMIANWNFTPKRGQHSMVSNVDVMPNFSKSLMDTLDEGNKQKVALLTNEILEEIVNDMCSKEGSGNKRYYEKLGRGLMLGYPCLDNALFRNNIRRRLNKNVPNEELSEDSDEEILLQPTPGRAKRTFTNEKRMDLVKKALSSINRNKRKSLKRKQLIEKATERLETEIFSRIFEARYARKSVNSPVDLSCCKYARLEVPCDEDFECEEAIRKTFGVRSNAMQGKGRDVGAILNVYPLLLLKKYLRVEAEVYLGSPENLKKYFDNVDIAWDAIGKLQKGKTAEQNFREILCSLGPTVVIFGDEEPQAGSQQTSKWPVLIKTLTETRIQYNGNNWRDFTGLQEGLAYLVLIMSLFDMLEPGRPQLYLLLEALFYGYIPKPLNTKSIMIINKLIDLAVKRG